MNHEDTVKRLAALRLRKKEQLPPIVKSSILASLKKVVVAICG